MSFQDSRGENADRIAGFRGGHARKIEVARWVRAAGLPLTVNAVVHRQNIGHLEEIIAMAVELDAGRLEVAQVQYYGWALKNRAAFIPTYDQLKWATDIVEKARVRLKGVLAIDYVVPDYYARQPKICMGGWGRRFMNINPAGRALPCHAAESIPGLAFDSVKDRKPWQTTVMADFDLKPGESGVAMKAVDGVHDDRGLAAFSIVMKPGAKCFAPDPSKGDGQYIVIMKGGIRHEGKDKKDLTVIWVARDEGPFQLEAGPEGCSALAVTFPVPGGGIPQEHKLVPSDGKGDFKTYQCILCAFVDDEEKGYPEAGLAPGTRWADVPDTFKCPDCEAMKADFEIIEF